MENKNLKSELTVINSETIRTSDEKLQTLIKKYDAFLVDLNVLVINVSEKIKNELPTPLAEGLKIMFKEQTLKYHQITPIVVRFEGGTVQLIAGETMLQALLELGFEMVTVLMMNVKDESEAQKIRVALQEIKPHFDYATIIKNFSEVKEAVKEARKTSGKDKNTDEWLSEIFNLCVSHVKNIKIISQQENAEELAKKLDSGKTIYSQTRGYDGQKTGGRKKKATEGAPVGYEPKLCKPMPEYDTKLMCNECPKYGFFFAKLEENQKKQLGGQDGK